jgi:hypothetical protein
MRKTYKIKLPHLILPCKIHIQHVVPSFFDNEELVIYRRYIRSRELWVEEMIYKHQLERYEV